MNNNLDSIVTALYSNYKPAYDNLYNVTISDTADSTNSTNKTSGFNAYSYIQFHAVEVNFGEETLNLTRNNATKNFTLSGDEPFKWVNDLTIKWRESDDWQVKKFHEEWLGLFYDKSTGRFMSDSDGSTLKKRYKKIIIEFPKSSSGDNKHYLILENVLPKNNGKISLGWKENANIVSHQMQYYVGKWCWSNSINSTSDTNK